MGVSLRSVRWKRVGLIGGITFLVLFIAWFVGAWFVIGHPDVDHPKHADAVMILGSPEENGRIEAAEALLAQHVSDQLVISLNSPDQRHAYHVCTHPPAGVHVTCFQPDPPTTRGEAQQARRLARQHGWTSIVVVTSTYHISRARTIFDRCIDGTVYMVAARRGIGPVTWAYQYLYQTLAYAKAELESGC